MNDYLIYLVMHLVFIIPAYYMSKQAVLSIKLPSGEKADRSYWTRSMTFTVFGLAVAFAPFTFFLAIVYKNTKLI